jgi:acyl CoA:acetate/3-ketoacid CoA transferase alpha subunit
MHKVYETAAALLAGSPFDGTAIAAAGFGLCVTPKNLIAAIRRIEQRTICTA